jgi:hypothetical protein
MSDQPPLHPAQWDLIELATKRVDVEYWTVLAADQRHHDGSKTLAPAKTPALLLNKLEMYAGALFRAEGDQYPKDVSRLGHWLTQLSTQIVARVMQAVDEVETESDKAKLSYHGLDMDEARKRLELVLAQVISNYVFEATPRNVERSIALATVAQQLTHYRDELHLTLDKMAAAADIDPRTVSRHLAGEAIPRPKNLVAYEGLFSQRAGRTIRITKGQRKVRVGRREKSEKSQGRSANSPKQK